MGIGVFLKLLAEIDANWELEEGVDWSEAEQIISELNGLNLQEVPVEITSLLAYAEENDEWDSDVVAAMPGQLFSAFASLQGVPEVVYYSRECLGSDPESAACPDAEYVVAERRAEGGYSEVVLGYFEDEDDALADLEKYPT
jgi:hypothetical protein